MNCRSNAKAETRQGNTRNIAVDFEDGTVISNDWRCFIQVRHKSTGNLTSIDREVINKNSDMTSFITMLTATETASLSEGDYVIGVQVENSVTGEVIEDIMELKITKQWVIKS